MLKLLGSLASLALSVWNAITGRAQRREGEVIQREADQKGTIDAAKQEARVAHDVGATALDAKRDELRRDSTDPNARGR